MDGVTETARLSTKQREALRLLFVCESNGDGWGVVSSDATCKDSGQAWVHWRTAIALWLRGLVEADEGNLPPDEWPEDPRIRLTPKGRERV